MQAYVSAPRRGKKGTRFCSETTRVYPILSISQKKMLTELFLPVSTFFALSLASLYLDGLLRMHTHTKLRTRSSASRSLVYRLYTRSYVNTPFVLPILLYGITMTDSVRRVAVSYVQHQRAVRTGGSKFMMHGSNLRMNVDTSRHATIIPTRPEYFARRHVPTRLESILLARVTLRMLYTVENIPDNRCLQPATN